MTSDLRPAWPAHCARISSSITLQNPLQPWARLQHYPGNSQTGKAFLCQCLCFETDGNIHVSVSMSSMTGPTENTSLALTGFEPSRASGRLWPPERSVGPHEQWAPPGVCRMEMNCCGICGRVHLIKSFTGFSHPNCLGGRSTPT